MRTQRSKTTTQKCIFPRTFTTRRNNCGFGSIRKFKSQNLPKVGTFKCSSFMIISWDPGITILKFMISHKLNQVSHGLSSSNYLGYLKPQALNFDQSGSRMIDYLLLAEASKKSPLQKISLS